MFQNIERHYAKSYGLELFGDLDYQAALVQSNPRYKVRVVVQPLGVNLQRYFSMLPRHFILGLGPCHALKHPMLDCAMGLCLLLVGRQERTPETTASKPLMDGQVHKAGHNACRSFVGSPELHS